MSAGALRSVEMAHDEEGDGAAVEKGRRGGGATATKSRSDEMT